MHRDREQESDFKPGHSALSHERNEWNAAPDTQHQVEAREHARQRGKPHRTHDRGGAEAPRQRHELRARE